MWKSWSLHRKHFTPSFRLRKSVVLRVAVEARELFVNTVWACNGCGSVSGNMSRANIHCLLDSETVCLSLSSYGTHLNRSQVKMPSIEFFTFTSQMLWFLEQQQTPPRSCYFAWSVWHLLSAGAWYKMADKSICPGSRLEASV